MSAANINSPGSMSCKDAFLKNKTVNGQQIFAKVIMVPDTNARASYVSIVQETL